MHAPNPNGQRRDTQIKKRIFRERKGQLIKTRQGVIDFEKEPNI